MKNAKLIISFSILSVLLFTSLRYNFFQYNKIKRQQDCIAKHETLISKKDKELEALKKDLQTKEKLISKMPKSKQIEFKVRECIGTKYRTVDISNCVLDSEPAFEEEISTHLSELKKLLTKEQYEKLMISQKHWETYRKAQKKLIYATIFNLQGTMYINIAHGRDVAITKYRAKDLEDLVFYMNRYKK